jgi:RNA polymerase sigma factor (sigma-70 family)
MPTLPGRLFSEFAAYYDPLRCPHAPPAARAFRLLWGLYRRRFHRWVCPWEFLATVYDTLHGTSDRYPGLFASFHPGSYRGRLPLEKHFLNMLVKRLRARFQGRRKAGRRTARAWRRAREELAREVRHRHSSDDPLSSLPEALATLDREEARVIDLRYWHGFTTARAIARELGIDHKTVARRHDRAIARLRAFYGVGDPDCAAA